MEQTTNTEQNIQTENTGNNDVQGAKKEQKLFTQEDVNNFIQSRLGRMKEQAFKEQEAVYSQKLAELEARERKLFLKERLSEREMPKELADIITGTDEKDIDAKLDALQKIYGKTEQKETEERSSGFITVGAAGSSGQMNVSDPIRTAMGLS